MSDIFDRLAEVRGGEGLSLRAFTRRIEERTGLHVAYDSARRYERGETRIPADYVAAVCRAFGVSSEWLLLGEGMPTRANAPVTERAFAEVSEIVRRVSGLTARQPEIQMVELVKGEWRRFTRGLPPRHRLRSAILESWSRSRRAGVEHDAQELPVRRVTDEELERRRTARRELLEAGRPHLQWLSAAVGDLPHVAYLACAEGIVLDALASDSTLLDEWGLHPGHDWSEQTMGTNGAGTALATGNVVAVIGPEHYLESAHGCTCLAAPIRTGGGDVVGAIDVSMYFGGWRPDRLVLVAYAAEMIEEALGRPEGLG